LRIALLEDDPAQAELLYRWFVSEDHRCYRFENGRDFFRAVYRESFDLVVIDWGLPDIPGDQVLARLRDESSWRVPVLFITSRDREEDIVHALEKGADDYMVKPVRRGETLARIAALARRATPNGNQNQVITIGNYQIDCSRRTITSSETIIELTQKEYDLALFLFRNVGRLLSRGHILENVWGRRPDLNTRTVDTHVSRVRGKLRLTPDNGWRLTAVYQHGYRLERVEPFKGKG
jgi:DNA-binding response OmpR family regulator